MSGERTGGSPHLGPVTAVPSKDGLRLILAGTGYLLAICLLQLVVLVGVADGGSAALPGNAMEVRDVVALFGWVGLMISGVAVIIVPNHLKVRVRPSFLPRLHLGLANVGLIGYFASALALPGSALPDLLLVVTSASYLMFGAALLGTVYPFVRRSTDGALGGSARSGGTRGLTVTDR